MNEQPSESALPSQPAVTDLEVTKRHAEYWRRNIRYMWILLAIWFLVSYGFGINLTGPLNAINLPGTSFPLGFWFAQQGSVISFIIIIFFYANRMAKLDKKYNLEE